jgi:hypothetical protein
VKGTAAALKFEQFAATVILDQQSAECNRTAEHTAVAQRTDNGIQCASLCSVNAMGTAVPRVSAAELSLQDFWDR